MRAVIKQIGLWPLLLGAFVMLQAQAIELSSKNLNGQLSVTLSEIDYPAQFIDKELDSGLPNTINLLISLNENKQPLHTLTVNIQVLYDLWDEVYIVKQLSSDGVFNKKIFKTKKALVTWLGKIEQRIIAVDKLKPNAAHQINAQVIVNPVKTERIKKIQAWIASSNGFTHRENRQRSNSSYVGSRSNRASGVSSSGVAASGPRFQKLFDQILEQYMNTEQIPALWRSKQGVIDVDLKKN
ncbi:MAG: hypothetical protein HRT35_36085 [Algicola sp.]|nr:hypothetical protein [Algicola sp.]